MNVARPFRLALSNNLTACEVCFGLPTLLPHRQLKCPAANGPRNRQARGPHSWQAHIPRLALKT